MPVALLPSGHVDSFARENLPPQESWPDLRLAEAGLSYPDRLNCVTELLDRHVAEGRGSRTAIIAPGLEWSYAGAGRAGQPHRQCADARSRACNRATACCCAPPTRR